LDHACKGVIFLGAAHNEVNEESFGRMAAKAAAVLQPTLEKGILDELEQCSSVLDQINDNFLKYMSYKQRGAFKAITFYEANEVIYNPLNLIESHFFFVFINSKVTIKRDSACIGSLHHHLRSLGTDHRNMCRFSQSSDRHCTEISGVVREFYDDILKSQELGCVVLCDRPNALLE
jgi:hypothetical protein